MITFAPLPNGTSIMKSDRISPMPVFFVFDKDIKHKWGEFTDEQFYSLLIERMPYMDGIMKLKEEVT